MDQITKSNSTSRYDTAARNRLLEPIAHGTALQPVEQIRFDIDGSGHWAYGFTVDLHWHPEIEILYFEKGDFLCEVNLDQAELHPGDFMLAAPLALHAIKAAQRVSCHKGLIFLPKALSFSYEDELQQTLIGPLLSGEITFPHFLRRSDPAYAALAPMLLELMDIAAKREPDWYLECKLGLLRLISAMKQTGFLTPAHTLLSAAEQRKIDRFKLLSAYMDEHLSETVTLEQLAQMAAVNSQYLCRFFREISGQSPIQYLICRRIEAAAVLLRETDRPVLEIAMDCGFDNVSYFIRKFRQLKGVTPGEFRGKQRTAAVQG